MDNVTQFPGSERVEVLGAKRFGNHVIVDGRQIPRLAAVKTENGYDIHLDDRFCIEVTEEMMIPVCWMVANALAIGAGYAWIGHEKHGVPFAPEVSYLGGEDV